MVPALQPRLEARGRQSAQPGRPPVGLPVARSPDPGEPVQDSGELRPGGGVQEREDRQEEASPDLAEIPATRRGAPTPAGRPHARGGEAVPDPALGRQRQELFDRLAGPSADPAGKGRQARLRLDHRRHRPSHPGQADPRHDPAIRPGGVNGGACPAVGRSAPVHRAGQEDYHLDSPEVPLRS